jgi:transcriptional regulator with XRE-family HTH domain
LCASSPKECGFTQVELAGKFGIVQTLVPDYETDRLRLTAEMVVRFAMALDVSLDELLHPNAAKASARKPSRKVLRRLEKIEELPPTQQTTLLRTIDTFLEAAAWKAARRAGCFNKLGHLLRADCLSPFFASDGVLTGF